MSTSVTRKRASRLAYTQEDMERAIKAVCVENVLVHQAAKDNNIPEGTLKQKIYRTTNFRKSNKIHVCVIGDRAEKKLAEHIKKLKSVGFEFSEKTIRKIASNFANVQELRPKSDEDIRLLGPIWYESFLKRYSTLIDNRKVENTSDSNAGTSNIDKIDTYFTLLEQNLTASNLINKPSNIYCVDEINLQQIIEQGCTVADICSNKIQDHKLSKKIEPVKIITCCNAEGNFLPPYCLFETQNKQNRQMLTKETWRKNMPLGSVIKKKSESSFLKNYWFMDWLLNHFIPKKKDGRCLLLLDSNESYIDSPNLIKVIEENDILLFCLPSHITDYLHPLRRKCFTVLKTYFRDVCYEWGMANPTEMFGRFHFSFLFPIAWSQAATTQMGMTGFRETGIYPFSPSAVLEHKYVLEHRSYISSESTKDKDNKDAFVGVTTDSSDTKPSAETSTKNSNTNE